MKKSRNSYQDNWLCDSLPESEAYKLPALAVRAPTQVQPTKLL